MSYISYVNIRQGTDSCDRFSRGNTLPLVQLPFGMAAFSPQTNQNAGNWYYHPHDRSLEGIRLTHQPSPWIGEWGALLMNPQADVPHTSCWSGYDPSAAILRPDYMKLHFLRALCDFELTPSERGAAFRLSFSGDLPAWLTLSGISGDFQAKILSENRIAASTDGRVFVQAKNFRAYFVFEFSEPVCDIEHSVAENSCLHVKLTSSHVQARMAISYISEEQAWHNLTEIPESFDAVQKNAGQAWEKRLSCIELDADEEQKRTFYSCLYRVFLFPQAAYEYAEDGRAVHYCPENGEILDGVRYTNNGFWDTYRTVYPLLSLIAPDDYARILDGFVQDYRDYGWLPRWSALGDVGCMPGTLIDAVIADAAVKGIVSEDVLDTALSGMIRHATCEAPERRLGRNGADAYRKHGYVPCDVETNASVNLTLDAAYGDFCIAQVAKMLGYREIEAEYRRAAGNYRNLFDPSVGFMRAKDSNGNMSKTFDPIAWGGEYTEGCAWQSSFAVPHDIEGLAALYGGNEALVAKLDELFATPPIYHVGAYQMEIHEMTEMATKNFGQCAICNQPSFSLPWLFAALGHQDKTAYWIDRIVREAFDATDGGFPGDEDNGTMAAWYIFAILGIYPLCPGKAEYVNAGKSAARSIRINGRVLDASKYGNFVTHKQLIG